MIALIIILALLLLLLMLPVGLDLAYQGQKLRLRILLGPLPIQLIPRRPKKPKKPKEPKEPKEEAPKPPAEKPSAGGLLGTLRFDDLVELARLFLKAVGRFFRFLSLDEFTLHLVLGAEDPYDAVLWYGRINAALGWLAPWFHRAFRVREEDVQIGVDPNPGAKPAFEGRLRFTWQIWELLHTLNCAAFAAARWYLKRRKEQRKQASAEIAQTIEEKG